MEEETIEPQLNDQPVLQLLDDQRKLLEEKFINNRLSLEDYVHGCHNYLRQQRIKPFVKAYDKSSILFNCLFWQIQIERKIIMERQLIEWNLGSQEQLNNVLEMLIKRRDQMVRRLLWETDLKIEKAYFIFPDLIEIITDCGHILYLSRMEALKMRLQIPQEIKKPKKRYFLPILRLFP